MTNGRHPNFLILVNLFFFFNNSLTKLIKLTRLYERSVGFHWIRIKIK